MPPTLYIIITFTKSLRINSRNVEAVLSIANCYELIHDYCLAENYYDKTFNILKPQKDLGRNEYYVTHLYITYEGLRRIYKKKNNAIAQIRCLE